MSGQFRENWKRMAGRLYPSSTPNNQDLLRNGDSISSGPITAEYLRVGGDTRAASGDISAPGFWFDNDIERFYLGNPDTDTSVSVRNVLRNDDGPGKTLSFLAGNAISSGLGGGLVFQAGTGLGGDDGGPTYIDAGYAFGGGSPGDVYIGTNIWTTNVRICGASHGLSFYGATPVTKQTVTGSKGGIAALSGVITLLENLGLLTDNTTA